MVIGTITAYAGIAAAFPWNIAIPTTPCGLAMGIV